MTSLCEEKAATGNLHLNQTVGGFTKLRLSQLCVHSLLLFGNITPWIQLRGCLWYNVTETLIREINKVNIPNKYSLISNHSPLQIYNIIIKKK